MVDYLHKFFVRWYNVQDIIHLCLAYGGCCGQLWVWHMFCGQDLWWTIPLHIFHWSCWDTLWIPNDHMDLSQTPCVQVPVVSSHRGLHGLCFGFCFAGPLPPHSLTNGPPIGVRFRESLFISLYSEIGQIHLSIEAQCDIILLPLGDCHINQAYKESTTIHHAHSHRFVIELLLWQKVFKPDEDELHRPPTPHRSDLNPIHHESAAHWAHLFFGWGLKKQNKGIPFCAFILAYNCPFHVAGTP